MRPIVKIIIPREPYNRRAATLSHEALFLYATFIFLVQFSLSFVALKFPGVLGFASNITADQIIGDTNNQRLANNLPALKLNDELSRAAAAKADYMFKNDYWAHVAPDGTTPWKFILDAGYRYVYAGENLAKDFQSSDDVVAAWMASKMGHRENILNKNYTDIGVAVVNGTLGGFQTTLVVQMFGSTSASLASNEVSAAPASKSPIPAAPAPQPAKVTENISPQVNPSPAPGVTAQPSPVTVTQASSSRSVPVIDVISLAKTVSYSVGFFLLSLFVLDGLIVFRRNVVRISGHNGAHILMLLLLLGSTFLLSPGVIR
ncbi:MAG: CAP domain-containing protein [Patescibacteria group bacterium]|nr:CAP domain-containing protein [Patescibacteria group bacterium]